MSRPAGVPPARMRDYQLAAIDAVCDLFSGQEVCRTEFTVTAPRSVYLGEGTQSALPGMSGDGVQLGLGLAESDLGIGNRLQLDSQDLLANLNKVQLRHGLKPSDSLSSRDFTVEMETGTGKTYVYLRTIFELNKRYGFTKFVIVVPSVAIKEGVYKSLQIMAPHFRSLYSGQPFEYFLYDSAKLNQVRNFATSQHLQVMVVTVGAINKKDVNNLYKDSEKTGGEKPIDLIRATQPVLIVDEPQSVDGGLEGRGKEAAALGVDGIEEMAGRQVEASRAAPDNGLGIAGGKGIDRNVSVFRSADDGEQQLVRAGYRLLYEVPFGALAE